MEVEKSGYFGHFRGKLKEIIKFLGDNPVWSLTFDQKTFKDGIYQCSISNDHKDLKSSSYTVAKFVKLQRRRSQIIIVAEQANLAPATLAPQSSTPKITGLQPKKDESDDTEYGLEDGT